MILEKLDLVCELYCNMKPNPQMSNKTQKKHYLRQYFAFDEIFGTILLLVHNFN
jgi:hypothetical protein